MLTLADVAARLEGVRWRNDHGIKAQCPLCRSRRPKLYVTAGHTHLLAYCCACDAPYADIARALDLDPRGFSGYTRRVFETSSRARSLSYYQRLCRDVLRNFRGQRSTTWGIFGAESASVSRGKRCSADDLRSAWAHGDLAPWTVRLALPSRPGRVMRAVAEDMEILLGLRLATGDDRPLPYGSEWAAKRLGLAERSVRSALDRLEAAGALDVDAAPRFARAKRLRPDGTIAIRARRPLPATYFPAAGVTVAPPARGTATRPEGGSRMTEYGVSESGPLCPAPPGWYVIEHWAEPPAHSGATADDVKVNVTTLPVGRRNAYELRLGRDAA